MVVGGLRLVERRRAAFIGRGILWIAKGRGDGICGGVDLLGIFLAVLGDILGFFLFGFVVFVFLFDALPEWEYG